MFESHILLIYSVLYNF